MPGAAPKRRVYAQAASDEDARLTQLVLNAAPASPGGDEGPATAATAASASQSIREP